MSTPSAADAAPDRVRALSAKGARVELVRAGGTVRAALELLASEGVTSLVVEGGPTLHAAFWEAGLVDAIDLYLSPRPLGAGGVEWMPFPVIGSGLVSEVTAAALGEDLRIEGYVHRTD